MSNDSPLNPPNAQPLVSVIIAAYNVAHYLGEALESVRAQTYKNFEIIVADDGSTDATAQVAQSRGDVRYFHQENSGCESARNLGCAAARGELLAFLDADDYWAPQKLALQVARWSEIPETGAARLVFSHVQQFLSPELDPQQFVSVRLPTEAQPGHLPGALLISRADFERIGPYRDDIGTDIEWFLRARDGGADIHVMPETLLFRRIHHTNKSRTQQDVQKNYVQVLKASLDRRRAAGNVTK